MKKLQNLIENIVISLMFLVTERAGTPRSALDRTTDTRRVLSCFRLAYGSAILISLRIIQLVAKQKRQKTSNKGYFEWAREYHEATKYTVTVTKMILYQ